jgi:hypothetical protein
MTKNPLLRLGFALSEFAKRNRLYSRGIEKSLKFAPCNKLGRSEASIPQIVFQAIVASFHPRKTAFLRRKSTGYMVKIYTALNKERTLKTMFLFISRLTIVFFTFL